MTNLLASGCLSSTDIFVGLCAFCTLGRSKECSCGKRWAQASARRLAFGHWHMRRDRRVQIQTRNDSPVYCKGHSLYYFWASKYLWCAFYLPHHMCNPLPFKPLPHLLSAAQHVGNLWHFTGDKSLHEIQPRHITEDVTWLLKVIIWGSNHWERCNVAGSNNCSWIWWHRLKQTAYSSVAIAWKCSKKSQSPLGDIFMTDLLHCVKKCKSWADVIPSWCIVIQDKGQ